VKALDVIVKDVGAVWLFTPVSDEAKEWFKENVLAEPWQWRGPSLAADRQPAQVLHAEIRRRGLRIQGVEVGGRPSRLRRNHMQREFTLTMSINVRSEQTEHQVRLLVEKEVARALDGVGLRPIFHGATRCEYRGPVLT
jgi:hypothetical protein